MKQFTKIIILILFCILYTNHTFAIDKGAIILEKNPKIYNTQKNIQQAQLIESEVILFKNRLLILQKNYLLEKDPIIVTSFQDIQEIIYILRKIQTTKVNKTTADHVIRIVINDLKNINSTTKAHLRFIKNNFLKKREKYNILSTKLSKSLDNIVNGLTKYYSKQKVINSKWRKILLELRRLQKKSKQLKNFRNIEFKNIVETKASLIRILRSVKKTIIKIKTISKQK